MKKLLVFLLVVGAALAGGAYWISQPRTVPVREGLFTYAPVERGTMIEAISATGLLQPQELLVVGSELPGTVVEILGKVNDLVAEGDVLLKLDDRNVRLKLEEANEGVATARAYVAQAVAAEDAARRALHFQEELAKKGGFRTDREQAEATSKAAQAGTRVAQARMRQAEVLQEEARLGLEKTLLKVPRTRDVRTSAGSPRRYVILERKVQRGQMVGPALPHPLFTLATDLRNMEVHVQVAEGDIGRVRVGLAATFTVSTTAEADVPFRGTVRQIRPLPTSVQGAVYYDTVLDVQNQGDPETREWRLRPGMTAAVDIIRREHKDVWKVPTAGLGLQLDEAFQSDAARTRLAQWRQRPDQADWKPVWIWDPTRAAPWPIFVRVGGVKNGEPGIGDGQFNEVLEWEPGQQPSADAAPFPVIINAPPARRPGLFEQPTGIKF